MYKGYVEKDDLEALFEAVLSLETPEECKAFFDDLCTIAEIKSMAQRWLVVEMLDHDATYADIVEKTAASSATISRVKRCLHYGADGYKNTLLKLKNKK